MKPSSLRQMAVTTRLKGVGGIIMRVAVVAAVVCLSVFNLSAVSSAQAAVRQPTSIAPQGLGPALQALAKERNFQLVYRSKLVKDLRTQGASGELTSDEALTQLLVGTGLAFRYLDERTVTVFPISSTETSSTSLTPVNGDGVQGADESVAGNGASKSVWNRIRLAQNEQSPQGTDAATNEDSKVGQSRAIGTNDQVDLGEIVVTGTNIRGVYPSSSPVEIYTAEDIARTGATTTEQFIGKLPQNLATRTQYASGYSLSAVNRESVNSIDLHGLGVGTTLTLLNGRRLALSSSGQAADVSLIPLSAIDRVEVLTDGASAIYGSDAIGGVVNFVLRDDLDGAETRLGYGGVTHGDLRQTNFTQTFGQRWNSGRVLVSYDYFSASALDRADRRYAESAGPGKLSPDDDRHGALLTVSQDVAERLTLDADLVFSKRDVENFVSDFTNPNPAIHSNTASQSETEQYFANVGLKFEVSDSLHASVLASYSDVDVETRRITVFAAMGLMTASDPNQDYSAIDATGMLGGSLFSLSGGQVRFSLGAGYVDEEYLGAQPSGGSSTQSLGRATTYAFGELFAPLVGEPQGIPLLHRLELTLAARYTRYEETSDPPIGRDFGDDTSPKIGLLWAPASTLSFRATYGESFRVPTLTELDTTRADNTLTTLPVAGVSSTVLSVRGPSPQLDAETAESYTFGLDYRPSQVPRLYLSATYFNVEYADRVAIGDTTGGTAARANPSAFPAVIFRASSPADIQGLLTSTRNIQNSTGINLADPQAASAALFALPNLWISDLRTRNLALSELDGLDLSATGGFDTQWGDVRIGVQLTKIFEYQQKVAPGSPINTVVDEVLFPVDFRARAYAGLSRSGFDGTISLNYVDDYTNPYAAIGAQDIESWTTVDLSLSYDFGNSKAGVLDGVRLSISAQNVFDEDPPFVTFNSAGLLRGDVGFDPANANPLGRFLTLGFSKAW